jgi:hypothetical protein
VFGKCYGLTISICDSWYRAALKYSLSVCFHTTTGPKLQFSVMLFSRISMCLLKADPNCPHIFNRHFCVTSIFCSLVNGAFSVSQDYIATSERIIDEL